MPSTQQIRRRIRSVENTAKITNAMSMIAASKMRRTQETALRGRPYSDHMMDLLADLAAQAEHDAEAHSLGESARLLEMVASAVQRIRDHHQRHEHDVQYRSLRADAASDDALATKALDLQRQLVLTQTNTMRIARMDA